MRSPTIILRWGLAFVFFYSAIAGLVRHESIVFLPLYGGGEQGGLALTLFSTYQLFLAVWLFWGRKLIWGAAAALVTFAAAVLFRIDSLSRVFPYVGLAFAALALFHLAEDHRAGGSKLS